jgi:SEC-C motif-containing protein
VRDVGAGGADDDTGEVDFQVHFQAPSGAGVLHERSRFERRAGRWVYVDGTVS